MNALRTRLLGLILLTVAVIWLATAWVVWHEARNELNELVGQLPAAMQAEIAHEHQEIVSEIAEHLVKPMLVTLPLLALLLVLAINWALSPLKRLAAAVAASAPEQLEPLSIGKAPAEVQPLIARLNQLFAAISQVLENERRFTADAAHELRTPLAALKAQAQVALAATQSPVREHALTQIIAGCDRATHLTEQLLLLARLDVAGRQVLHPIALQQLIPSVLADLAGVAIEQGSTLEWLEGPELTVQGDATLLAVALRNLVNNALRHNPAGVQISVSLSLKDGNPAICIRDNGSGIVGPDPMQMLQRFRRGEANRSEGTGLGLSIVQRIATLHCARLTLENIDDHGSPAGLLACLHWQTPINTAYEHHDKVF
jgi:two-component system sensor histidine kinase QseC